MKINNIKFIKHNNKQTDLKRRNRKEKGSILVLTLSSMLIILYLVLTTYNKVINNKINTNKKIDIMLEEYNDTEKIEKEMDEEYIKVITIERERNLRKSVKEV